MLLWGKPGEGTRTTACGSTTTTKLKKKKNSKSPFKSPVLSSCFHSKTLKAPQR